MIATDCPSKRPFSGVWRGFYFVVMSVALISNFFRIVGGYIVLNVLFSTDIEKQSRY